MKATVKLNEGEVAILDHIARRLEVSRKEALQAVVAGGLAAYRHIATNQDQAGAILEGVEAVDAGLMENTQRAAQRSIGQGGN
jgi:predicted transcriptional regulator